MSIQESCKTACSLVAPAIDRNSYNNDRADDDLLNVVGPTYLLASISQKRHDQSADHRSQNASLAAIQTASADHNGSDDVQLRSGSNRRIALSQTRHLHHSCETEEQSCKTIDPDLQSVGGNPARAGSSFV